jgi:antitoxin component YwqK of YwqJK toxin-antitoxin module
MKKDIENKNDKGQLHGIQIRYHDTGEIKYKHNYINGHLHGEQVRYYDNGQILYKHNYINGKYHGEQIEYWYNGQIDYKNNYINGKLVSPEEYLAYERKLKMDMISNL